MVTAVNSFMAGRYAVRVINGTSSSAIMEGSVEIIDNLQCEMNTQRVIVEVLVYRASFPFESKKDATSVPL